MSKHTHGNWTILPEEDKEYIRIRGTVLGGRYKIANVLSPSYFKNHPEFAPKEIDESWANARLIASAPELLEALKGLLEVADFISENVPGAGWRMAQHKARVAINKAEGKA